MSLAAFIPARAGSKRIPNKNLCLLGGHPLLAYAIQGAQDAGIFGDRIYVSTDSDEIGRVAEYYGATFIKRPEEFARDDSPDAQFITHLQQVLGPQEQFAILRPTSPFRTGGTIRRAYAAWDRESHLKAVEPVRQHPAKMWIVSRDFMWPFQHSRDHLCQTNTLQKLYVQNASLELRTDGPMTTYQPFLTQGYEGFDINDPDDLILAEALVARGLAVLPRIGGSGHAI